MIKVGPVLNKTAKTPLSPKPCLILDGDCAVYEGDTLCEKIHIIGAVSAARGYPLSGEYGELACNVRAVLDDGTECVFPIRNGIELTTVFKTYRSSRIDPRADSAERFMEFSYDKSYEQYVINELILPLGGVKHLRRVEIIGGNNGYAILNYEIFTE